MSTLAVVLALAGTSYAAGLAANSVKSKQIKDGAVRTVDVKDGGLLALDFKPGELPAGPAGPKGAPGQNGVTGPAGPTYGHTRLGLPGGLGSGENVVAAETFTLPAAGPVFVTAMTNSGHVDCTSASSTVLGVTIDGIEVPGTTRSGTNNVNAPFNVSGVSASLSAGDHTIRIAGTCLGAATSNGLGVVEPSLSVVLLGSS
jgi:hypothetical protein